MAQRTIISVVLPILNEASYIRQALESILNQDYEPIEVIVVDGGSTDGTLDIVKEYPVELVVAPGMGQAASINLGWRKSSGQILAYFAGDDYYKPGAFSIAAEAFRANPDVGLVHGDAEIINAAGQTIGLIRPGHVSLRDLLFWNSILTQSLFIRRDVLDKVGMADEKLKFALDYDLWLRSALYFPIRYIPKTLSCYRLHAASEDASNPAMVGEVAAMVVDRFLERPDLPPDIRAMKKHAIAGSRILRGRQYYLAKRRTQAWRDLLTAIQAEPSSLLTHQALSLIVHLLWPGRLHHFSLSRLRQRIGLDF